MSVLLAPPGPANRRQRRADVYLWGRRSIEFHHCRVCGRVMHWAPVDTSRDRMGVNANLMEPDVLKPSSMRHLDGASTSKYLDK